VNCTIFVLLFLIYFSALHPMQFVSSFRESHLYRIVFRGPQPLLLPRDANFTAKSITPNKFLKVTTTRSVSKKTGVKKSCGDVIARSPSTELRSELSGVDRKSLITLKRLEIYRPKLVECIGKPWAFFRVLFLVRL
jgi:hypothetical protein